MDKQYVYKKALEFAKHLKDITFLKPNQDLLIAPQSSILMNSATLEKINVKIKPDVIYEDELSPEILQENMVLVDIRGDKESIIRYILSQDSTFTKEDVTLLEQGDISWALGLRVVTIDLEKLDEFFKRYLLYLPFATSYYEYSKGVLQIWSDDKLISQPDIFDFRGTPRLRMVFEIFFEEFDRNGRTKFDTNLIEERLKYLKMKYTDKSCQKMNTYFDVVHAVNEINRKYKEVITYRKQVYWQCNRKEDVYEFKILPYDQF